LGRRIHNYIFISSLYFIGILFGSVYNNKFIALRGITVGMLLKHPSSTLWKLYVSSIQRDHPERLPSIGDTIILRFCYILLLKVEQKTATEAKISDRKICVGLSETEGCIRWTGWTDVEV
jgi:hypothetical protein